MVRSNTPVRGAQSGSFSVASRPLKFSNVKSVETSKLNTFSWLTSKSTDSYSVQAAVGTGGVPAAQIIGSSNGSAATNWIFFDIPTVTLDAGIGDSATGNDIVGINTSGLLARGLSNLKILTGDGNDIISVVGSSLNLASTVNRLTIDGGVGESTVPVRVEVDNDGLLYLLSWQNRRLNVDVDAQTLRTLFPEVGFNHAIDTFETISLKTEDRQMYDARDKAARDHQWLITLDQSPTFVKLQD